MEKQLNNTTVLDLLKASRLFSSSSISKNFLTTAVKIYLHCQTIPDTYYRSKDVIITVKVFSRFLFSFLKLETWVLVKCHNLEQWNYLLPDKRYFQRITTRYLVVLWSLLVSFTLKKFLIYSWNLCWFDHQLQKCYIIMYIREKLLNLHIHETWMALNLMKIKIILTKSKRKRSSVPFFIENMGKKHHL